MLILTDEDIREDIRAFEARIAAARDKLAALPEGFLPLQEHKKREQTRQIYEDEIKHVKRLIGYAMEALHGECQGECKCVKNHHGSCGCNRMGNDAVS